MVMSEYYTKEQLITVLKEHIHKSEHDRFDWDRIIENGRVCSYVEQGVEGCYVYEIRYSSELPLCIFVHPVICVEVWYDPFKSMDELGV